MKKILTLFLAALTLFGSFAISACSIENREPNGSFGVNSGADSSVQNPSSPEGEPFTVTLQPPVGESLDSLEGIYAIWTEKGGVNVYQAPFSAEGVATSYEPDGEYQVTLSDTPEGFTYNPNIYTANNDDNQTSIALYPLREFTGNGAQYDTPYKAATDGAYRFTFTKPEEELYLVFEGVRAGTTHFRSLLDVTKDEVLPILYECYHPTNATVRKQIVGGGEESSYTKNFYASYALTGSQEMLFKLGVETTNPNAYPVVVDLLIEITAYEDDTTGLEKAAVPELKLPENRKKANSDPWVAYKPRGTFVLLADALLNNSTYGRRIPFEMDMIKKVYKEETDSYYYYLNKEFFDEKYPGHNLYASYTGEKMIYARLARDINGIVSSDNAGNPNNDMGLSYRTEFPCPLPNGKGKDYSEFFAAYLARVNSEGDYPVDEYLRQFLEDYSISHRIFWDGYGNAEGTLDSDYVYAATSDGRWLFACGFYTQDNRG